MKGYLTPYKGEKYHLPDFRRAGRGKQAEDEHQNAFRQDSDPVALRRQPAEGAGRAVACQQPGRADPGRAHPRHRRGRQVRDLLPHQRNGEAGQGGAVHFLGTAGDSGHVRSHLCDE